MSVLIVTSLGDIVVDLFPEKCPLTSKNFLKLCKIKYYNGSLFHSVQKDFTAQAGDPTGSGMGGDSVYKFLYGDQARFFGDEIHQDLKHTKTGIVAMASAGDNLNASQFYFTLRDDLEYLDGKHTIFGEVAEGLDTLTRINEAYVDENGRPYKNIRIKHTYILDDPFDDPPQLSELIPEASPEGKPIHEIDEDVRLEDDWIPMDEQLAPFELDEVIRAKEAHSSAVVLEAIGDIPEADIKPPDNVLFVCKLNPVTQDEDLHTIFSRFGIVTSADIIRDYKTGDSLCYAFIEFETKEASEQAYFKMDNALIDDRRIHVDFSQSVSKLWSQYRHRCGEAGKGKGCFKCGHLDHVARDCPEGPVSKHTPPKYVLKHENSQHGGDGNSRYDMIFDQKNMEESGRKNNRRRSHYSSDNAEDFPDSRNSKVLKKEPGRAHVRDDDHHSRRKHSHRDGNSDTHERRQHRKHTEHCDDDDEDDYRSHRSRKKSDYKAGGRDHEQRKEPILHHSSRRK